MSRQKALAVITGGTSGIGFEIARLLGQKGYELLVIGRDSSRAATAVKRLATSGTHVEFIGGDLRLVSEADRIADRIRTRTDHIALLVHCAGAIEPRARTTIEGVDAQFAVNYLTRFALTERLAHLLATTPTHGSSTVLLVSGAAKGAPIRYEEVGNRKAFGLIAGVKQFCRANDLFTLALINDGLPGTHSPIRAGCIKLGVVRTAIRRGFPWWMKVLVPIAFDPWIGQSPLEAAHSAIEVLSRIQLESNHEFLFTKIRRLRAFDLPVGRIGWSELMSFTQALTSRIRSAAPLRLSSAV